MCNSKINPNFKCSNDKRPSCSLFWIVLGCPGSYVLESLVNTTTATEGMHIYSIAFVAASEIQ